MTTTVKDLLDCAESEMATATYGRLKDFDSELREMLEDYRSCSNSHARGKYNLLLKILPEKWKVSDRV